MQTLIHVVCTPGMSLRDRIGRDAKRLAAFGLQVSEQKRMSRSHGWSKLHSVRPERDGAINVHWDRAATALVCRIVTRTGDPGPITGDLVGYLMTRFRNRIEALTIVP